MTVPETETEELDEPPFSPQIVSEVLKTFGKTVRAFQLYLPNNPMHSRAMEAAREAFASLWEQTDSLTLKITETQFSWEGRPVLEEAERSGESLPWTFYKDGIRELKIEPGFEGEDLTLLLNVLQRVRQSSADDDDLLTLMWEREFQALEYRYVEVGAHGSGFSAIDGGEDGKGTFAGITSASPRERIVAPVELESEQEAGDAVAGAGAAPMKSSGIAKMEDYDSTLYFLDDNEIEYLQAEIKRDFSTDLRMPVLASLFDTFEQERDPTVREEICGILDYFLLILLSTTQFRTAAYLLREASVASERAPDIVQSQRQRLAELAALLSDPAALGQLLQSLEDTPLRPPQVELNELFQQFKARALETVLSWIGRSNNAELRLLLENAASRLAASHTAELVRLIGSEDDVVVGEAVRRAAALKTPAAVPSLGRLLSVAAPEMRISAVNALNEIGSPGALQVLERAIADEDRDIRVAAVRALGTQRSRAALPKIEAAIKSKELREANLTEKMAFFEAYGLLCGDGGIPLLDGILQQKSGFVGKKDNTELRACAASALGKISSPKAIEALNRATGDKDVIVRNAVGRAIRGATG